MRIIQKKDKEYKQVIEYLEGLENYNSRCEEVFSLALAQEHYNLAKRIIPLFKGVPSTYIREDDISIHNYLTYDARDKAQKIYDETIKKSSNKDNIVRERIADETTDSLEIGKN